MAENVIWRAEEACRNEQDSPFFIFPKSLMPDAEKQFPAKERVIAIHKYVQNHPDIERRSGPAL